MSKPNVGKCVLSTAHQWNDVIERCSVWLWHRSLYVDRVTAEGTDTFVSLPYIGQ